MSRHGVLVGIGALVMGGLVVSSVVGAQIVATGVLESGSSRSSRCTAISEDGQWVVGTSRKNGWKWPFYWSASGGIKDMGNPSGGNCTVTGCATVGGSTLVACGNIGGVARKYQNGAWSILPGNADNVVQAYAISRNNATGETWIAGSTVGADSMINEKAWRYRWSNNTYIHFWGYYQDAYGIARNGWAVGKNNWGNGYPDPRYRHDRPIFIFDWTKPGDADGRYGWDQLKPFAGYGEDLPAEGRATAINGGATWACGFMTYNPNNLGVHHAFKWQVPSNPVVGATPNQNWPLPIDLGTLGVEDTTSEAYCISDNATLPVIGGLSRGSFRYSGDKAVYWCAEGANDLYVVLQGLGVDVSRWSRLLRVTGVAVTGQSQTGTILVGYGLYDDDNNAGTADVEMGFVATLPYPPPEKLSIIQHPQSTSACAGANASFTVTAAGLGTISYQWQKNRVNLSNGGRISGVTTPTLTISNTTSSDSGNYRCVVTNAFGSMASNEAVLAAGGPVTPVSSPPTVHGSDAITWRWSDVSFESGYRVKDDNGVLKSGNLPANTTSWQETGLSPNTQYTRRVHAYNDCGESGASGAQSAWTLSAPPTSQTVQPNKSSVCRNGVVTWTAIGGFGSGTVQYYRYVWDRNPGHTWTGSEAVWSSGSLKTLGTSEGNWYLHVRGYNALNVANGTYDVKITVTTGSPADLDGDCDVDGADLNAFLACKTGDALMYDPQALPEGCAPLFRPGGELFVDFDKDGDVDQVDFGVFQTCLSGSGTIADPTCGE
ncbi:MAG: immunoglobulin domain-containing protein [Phycisphaerae bacterium]